ncbi:PAS domain S-box protein [Paenibacillus anaericanus]|uniref:histidine kinase n=1 Tax=Paenibacillus anaericanus TaxID=170367 RepID=A0A3S1DJV4_9BACL|nr:PAS domain S-box protein [Paenibacillus anaericanus]RUT42901.1 PAS domain S-box protein [Paenibacillus anaericanus]
MKLLSNEYISTWTIDKDTNVLTLSNDFKNLIGFSSEEMYHSPHLLIEMVYMEDIHMFDEHMDRLYSGLTSSLEHRIVIQTGEFKWVQSVGIPMRGQDNKICRIDGVVLDITEQKASQEKLERTFSSHQKMLDTIDVAIWSFDLVTRKVFISDAIVKITGYPMEKASGVRFFSEIAHIDELPHIHKIMDSIKLGIPDLSEYRIIHANGEIRWLQISIIPSMDKSQTVVRHDGAVIDITARKVMEEALQRSEQRYKSLFEYNTDVVCELDLLGNIVDMNQAAENITGERLNSIKESRSIMNIFDVEHTQQITDYFKRAIEGYPSTYTVTSHHKDGGVTHWDMKNVPIQVNNRIVGAFAIAKDVTLNREIEKKLADREAEYRLITDNMKDMMGVLDYKGNFVVASPSSEKILGIPEGLIKDTTILEYIHPDDRQYLIDQILDMLQTRGSKLLRSRFIHADGYIIYLESLCTPVLGVEGEIENIVIVSRDISKRVKVENELRESEERYRRLIELSPQPMVLIRQSKVVYINPAGLHMLGATNADELDGQSIFDYVHLDYRVEAMNRMLQLMNKQYLGSTEYKIIRMDGQVIETEVIGIYDEIAETILILIKDVTERLKMERALQESEERYRRLVELSPVAIAVYKAGQINYINPAGARMLGINLTGDTFVPNLMDWIHPNYRDGVSQAMENTMLNGYSIPAEYQVVRSDSHVILVSMLSIYDSQSASVQLMFEDITEKKRVEQALLESKELNQQIIELSPEAIVLHSDYKFIDVNSAALVLFGVSGVSELVGRSIFEYAHPDNWTLIQERMGEIYRQQRASSTPVEQKIIRSDGEIIDVEVVANSIPYKGEYAAISLFRDIRDRKRAERDRKLTERVIRESEERYFRLQTSLDEFSHDLFGVMKIPQMEQRLLQEVREILNVSNVRLIEVECNKDKLCEIIESDRGYYLKLDENKGKSYLLCIDEKPPSLQITSIRVWLKTIGRYVSVLFDNFLLIEDLTKELEQAASGQVAPTWLLRFIFNLSENERKRLAQDLHDSALQEQIIWYRKLDFLLTDGAITGVLREQLGQITEGLLNVVYQIRITCNELRPPMLIRDGLISSLEALFDFTQLRANYSIHFDAVHFNHRLHDDIIIGLYRIVQELLANATKHSSATKVHILLYSQGDRIRLEYEDNGVGMDLTRMEESDSLTSMGMNGMKERVRSMDGTIQLLSPENQGLSIYISIPARE